MPNSFPERLYKMLSHCGKYESPVASLANIWCFQPLPCEPPWRCITVSWNGFNLHVTDTNETASSHVCWSLDASVCACTHACCPLVSSLRFPMSCRAVLSVFSCSGDEALVANISTPSLPPCPLSGCNTACTSVFPERVLSQEIFSPSSPNSALLSSRNFYHPPDIHCVWCEARVKTPFSAM